MIGHALKGITGVDEAFVYGSWAARHAGELGHRPVGDIDLLILGQPDRDALYVALAPAEERLGRPIQVTIRESGWLESGTGSFHDTVATRPRLRLPL